MNPSVCVLVINWNGWADTIEALESVFRLRSCRYRVVVCDNGSTDGSLNQISAWANGALEAVPPSNHTQLRSYTFPPVEKPIKSLVLDRAQAESGHFDQDDHWDLALIDIGENLGFAGGNNVGLRFALSWGFDYVWLLNNDTVVTPNALDMLVKRMEQSPDAGMCGSTLLHYHDVEKVQAYGGAYYCKWIALPWHQGRLKKASDPINKQRAEKWMNYVVGASLLVSRKFLLDIGLMCEDYFLYFEELDWSLRGRGKYSLAYAPKSIVYHKVGGSIGTSSHPAKKSLLCDYYSNRNRLFFTKRYFPGALPSVYMSLMFAMLTRLLFGEWRRAGMILCILLGVQYDIEGQNRPALRG